MHITRVAAAVLALHFTSAVPSAQAQSSIDDQPAQELWWDRVGALFFSDSTMQTLRSEDEIRAQLTGLSPEDREALRRRCDGQTEASSPKTGDADEVGVGKAAAGGSVADGQVSPEPAAKSDNASETTITGGSGADASDGEIAGQPEPDQGAGAEEPQVADQSGQVSGDTGLGPSPAVFARVCDLMGSL